MTTTTYIEAIKNGHTRIFDISLRSNVTLSLSCGKVAVKIEASGTTTHRDIYDEVTYLAK